MKEAHDHKRVSPEGKEFGKLMAEFVEPAIQHLAAEGEPDGRCKTCAFRIGTVPNGCAQTQMDAAKCVFEGIPFHCHSSPGYREPCFGWFAGRVRLRGVSIDVPWELSPADPEPKP